MKKILTLFTAIMASTCLWAWSDFYDDESKLYYLFTGNTTVEVASEAEWESTYPVNYSYTTVTIPSTVTYEGKTYRVTSIGPNAFAECKALTTITIAESVTSIQEFAFASCPKLKSITIPNSVKSIDNTAFDFCTALSKIFVCSTREFEALSEFDVIYCDKIVDGLVISSLDNPNGYAEIIDYTGPTNITSITIPEEAEDIREGVFNQCKSLKSITWNAKKCGNTYGEPFDAIKQNITSFVFGDKVEHIPAGLCKGMSKLTSVTIPESVKSIGKDAFIGTGIYTNKSNWKNGALYINNCLVAVDKNATSYTIMPDTRLIAGGVFKNCSKLTSITIPESVISIGEEAFEGCTALTTITIPESVTSIASFAFNGTAFYDNTSNWENGALYINNCLIDIDRNKENKDFIIKPGTRLIAAHACYSCETLESITIPESVQSIGDYAFLGCYSLKSITIPESVKSIGEGIIEGCEALEKIFVHNSSKNKTRELEGYSEEFITYYDKIVDGLVISNNKIVTLIDPNTITTVNIPEGVTSIEGYQFSGCSSLTSVTIPASVTSIGIGGTFQECTSLKSVQWNATNCTIDKKSNGNYAPPFYYLSNIENFTFGNNVKSIPAYLCSGLSGLTSITIPNGVTSIGDAAFYDCKALKTITIPESVTSIGRSAFYGCGALKSVTINSNTIVNSSNLMDVFGKQVTEYILGNSVKSIEKNAFSGCSLLTSIIIPASVTSIGDAAFYDCKALKTITIPESVTSIGRSAFYGCKALKSVTINSNTIVNSYNLKDVFGEQVTEYIIGNSVTSIREGAFKNCYSLTAVTIQEGVTSIGDYAFSGCSKLNSIIIPESVTSIGKYAFSGCSSLTAVTIQEGVKSIETKAFDDCKLLKSVTIPASVTSIGEGAFFGCGALHTINYAGTKKQWKKIKDTKLTLESQKQVVVICSDGEVKLRGK